MFFGLGLLEEIPFLYDLYHGWHESFVNPLSARTFSPFQLALALKKEWRRRTVGACIGGNRCAVNAVVATDDLVENG